MKRFHLKKAVSPEGVEAFAYMLVCAMGVTGVGLTIFLGKVYAAILIAVLCFGACVRIKRGHVNKEKK